MSHPEDDKARDKPWYRRTGYQILLTLLISALIAAALLPLRTMKPRAPPMMKAKASSSNYSKFVEKHGDDVYELEALPPKILQQELRGKLVDLFSSILAPHIAFEKHARGLCRGQPFIPLDHRQRCRLLERDDEGFHAFRLRTHRTIQPSR